ncbi:MAG: hypothetical protein IJP70_09840 [Bacteroidales bacterium]|nr:hypothetical protein [Bacteroidales bacterium]
MPALPDPVCRQREACRQQDGGDVRVLAEACQREQAVVGFYGSQGLQCQAARLQDGHQQQPVLCGFPFQQPASRQAGQGEKQLQGLRQIEEPVEFRAFHEQGVQDHIEQPQHHQPLYPVRSRGCPCPQPVNQCDCAQQAHAQPAQKRLRERQIDEQSAVRAERQAEPVP